MNKKIMVPIRNMKQWIRLIRAYPPDESLYIHRIAPNATLKSTLSLGFHGPFTENEKGHENKIERLQMQTDQSARSIALACAGAGAAVGCPSNLPFRAKETGSSRLY
jgi:hypothetical protein